MFEVMVESGFSAAHQLREYKGKCENLHGHNWKVQIWVRGDVLHKNGILADFCDLKSLLDAVLSELDHKNLNELPVFQEYNPTAESLSKYIYDILLDLVAQQGVHLHKVTGWESENSMSSYFRDAE